ncbi:MAG: hypothetical protein LBS62_00020 [Clostridiales bacterium]|jgi:hypothetical protein|nr:hypothetical protein [Clostridiales bacterium]
MKGFIDRYNFPTIIGILANVFITLSVSLTIIKWQTRELIACQTEIKQYQERMELTEKILTESEKNRSEFNKPDKEYEPKDKLAVVDLIMQKYGLTVLNFETVSINELPANPDIAGILTVMAINYTCGGSYLNLVDCMDELSRVNFSDGTLCLVESASLEKNEPPDESQAKITLLLSYYS